MSARFPLRVTALAIALAQSAAGYADGPATREPALFGPPPGPVLASAAAPSPNQETADRIALHLRQSGRLHGYLVNIAFQNGTAELSGRVADQLQREEVVRIVQTVPGVERVRDYLALEGGPTLRLTQAAAPEDAGPQLQPAPQDGPPPRREGAQAPAAGGNNAPPEPTPIFQAGPPTPGPEFYNAPRMPPYAWPTYAPYNNYSRVAYPTLYPYQAWPFIGPFYPFPKIPPGWRSVKLTWQDGHWWYGRTASGHDWWRVRFW